MPTAGGRSTKCPLEEYLAGAVKAEAGDRMPLEMLKAQAIVARTYAAYQAAAQCRQALPHRRVHRPSAIRRPRRCRLTRLDRGEADAGQVLLWQGKPLPGLLPHPTAAGHTEDPRVVFAASNMPALRPVRVEFPSASPYHRWRLDMRWPISAPAAPRAESRWDASSGSRLLERSTSLRVSQIAIRGVTGRVVLRGNDLRRLLGYDTLKSTLFAVAWWGEWPASWAAATGTGSGSTSGAPRPMAELGTREQIVEYYYRGPCPPGSGKSL